MPALRKAAFIDRDGVINEERHYVHRIEDFRLLPRVAEGLALLRDTGHLLVVVTNQAGIARGYYDEPAMQALHAHMRAVLADQGVHLDAIYHCPHHPQGSVAAYVHDCDCRKPAPGMLLRAAADLDIDVAQSLLIGDKMSDIEAAQRAGVRRTALVETGHAIPDHQRSTALFTATDLLAAARALTDGAPRFLNTQ
jgi:D-glycero-D-manno-heptose 1,7-bisphosphate phosphatase